MDTETMDPEVEQPIETDPEVEADQPAGEGAPEPEGETAEPEPKDDAASDDIYASKDGRDIPEKLRPLFKQHPELKSMYFENREVRKAGGAKALIAAAKALESAGGRDGIAAATEELGEWRALEQQYDAGDPSVAQHLATSDPENFAKFAPAVIEQLATANPEVYGHTIGRIMLNTMRDFSIYPALQQIGQLAEKHPELKAAFEPLVRLWNTVFDLAQNVPERKVDPQRQKLDQDRQQLEREKAETFAGSVKADARSYMESVIERELTQQFAKTGVDIKKLRETAPDSFEDLVAFCDRRIARALTSDPEFTRVRDARWAAGDREGLVSLVRKKIDAVIGKVGQQARDHFTRLGGSGAAQAKPRVVAAATDKGRVVPGTIRLQKSPVEAGYRIDWSRVPKGYSSVEDAMFDNKAFVHGRKELVTW